MKIQNEGFNASAFLQYEGMSLQCERYQEAIHAIRYPVHSDTDVSHQPCWATDALDMLERQLVCYSPEDIATGNFLGMRWEEDGDQLVLSLGEVGETEPLASLIFTIENGRVGKRIEPACLPVSA